MKLLSSKGSVEARGGLRRIEAELDELDDVDVDYISLVKRGANRAPFKIIKREDESMLDFSKAMLFRKSKKQVTPAVAAVLVNKTDHTDSIIAQIAEAGFSPVETIEQDEIMLLKLASFDEDDAIIVQLNDDIAVVVANAKKQFMSFPDSTSFRENMSSAGFVPGFHMSLDTLAMTVSNIMSEATTKSDGRSMISDAIGDFQTHVLQLMDSVPETAFKLESIIPGDVPSKKEDASKEDVVEKDAVEKDDKKEESIKDASEAKAKEGDVETPDPKDEAEINEDMKELAQNLMAGVEQQFSSLRDEVLQGLTKTEEATQSAVEALRAEVADQSEKLEAAKQEMNEAVNGTVHRGALTDDNLSSGGPTRKSQDGEDGDVDWSSAFRFPGFESPNIEIAIEDR